MTNFERLKAMSATEFADTMWDLYKLPYAGYVSYDKWLESDNPDVMAFVRYMYEAWQLPSNAEISAFMNKMGCADADAIAEYRESKKRRVLVLNNDTRMYDTDYAIVLPLDSKQITKVPLACLRQITK